MTTLHAACSSRGRRRSPAERTADRSARQTTIRVPSHRRPNLSVDVLATVRGVDSRWTQGSRRSVHHRSVSVWALCASGSTCPTCGQSPLTCFGAITTIPLPVSSLWAEMAELVDALASGASGRKPMGVRVPLSAPHLPLRPTFPRAHRHPGRMDAPPSELR